MKKLKNLAGVEVLSVNERKNIIGGGPGIEACYCPGTGIFAGVIHPGEGETCAAVIEENCPLES
ncbi:MULTISPECIES: hypothetical protein [Flavobacterium]|jgi:hypothetical protein|uniref:hypothetical protein n=1 Tax=Flavobacterium TaxID=237 RepID=UPI0011F074EA|nr:MULTISPECIES: hypothetical protein [Flavobacterium]WDF60045.1 hypothetical protein PQ462_01445 [Flavobacterium sp. KACC 22758]